MSVHTTRLQISTKGNTEILNLTDQVERELAASGIRDGMVCVFVVGSTAAITTTEFEPGLVKTDFRTAFEKIAPEDGTYSHESTWNDDNGHSHIRAGLVGPSVVIPFSAGKLCLGTWQQIVLMDFDTRARRREVVLQYLGE